MATYNNYHHSLVILITMQRYNLGSDCSDRPRGRFPKTHVESILPRQVSRQFYPGLGIVHNVRVTEFGMHEVLRLGWFLGTLFVDIQSPYSEDTSPQLYCSSDPKEPPRFCSLRMLQTNGGNSQPLLWMVNYQILPARDISSAVSNLHLLVQGNFNLFVLP